MRTGRALIAVAALVTALAACRDDKPSPPRTPVPSTAGKQHPLGFKWDLPRVDRYAPFLRSVAGGATFTEVVWCDVEPEPGEERWTLPDRIISKATELRQRVFLKLRVGSCWVNGDRGGAERGVNRRRTASAMPDDVDAYREFVRNVVRRYPAVEQFAVENEVNSASFWSGTVDGYRDLVATAAAVIRRERPSARVFDSGTSSVAYGLAVAGARLAAGDHPGAVNGYRRYYARRFESRDEFPHVGDTAALERVLAGEKAVRHLAFLNAAVDMARRRVTDGLQIHYYESSEAAADLTQYLAVALPGVRIEAWEVGLFWADAPGGREPADEALRSVAALLGGGIDQVIWLPMAHNPNGRRSDEIRLGAANADGSSRPLGVALALVASGLAHAQVDLGTARRPGAGLDGLVVTGRDGAVAIVWALQGTTRLAGDAPRGSAVTDAAGTRLAWGPGGFDVAANPVVITGGRDVAAAVTR